MRKLRFVAAAVLICSWACAGGDAPESSGDGAQTLAQQEQPSGASSATAKLADDPNAQVVGGGETPATEGSNTNWLPIDPWLDAAHRPEARERTDPRKPGGGQPSNMDTPDQGQPSTLPAQQGPSSSSSSSSGSDNSDSGNSGSSNSTPSPD